MSRSMSDLAAQARALFEDNKGMIIEQPGTVTPRRAYGLGDATEAVMVTVTDRKELAGLIHEIVLKDTKLDFWTEGMEGVDNAVREIVGLVLYYSLRADKTLAKEDNRREKLFT